MAKEIRVTFKDDELELFEYIRNSPSPSMFIKMVMANKMQFDKLVQEQNLQLMQQYQMMLMGINANPMPMQQVVQPIMQQPQPVAGLQQVQQEQPKQEPMIDLSDLGLDI